MRNIETTLVEINSALANGFIIDEHGQKRKLNIQIQLLPETRNFEGVPMNPNMGLPPVGHGYYAQTQKMGRF